MRENRTSGSEGGEAQINELSLPLSPLRVLSGYSANRKQRSTGLSPDIIRRTALSGRLQQAAQDDPIAEKTGLSEEDVEDALHELGGMVEVSHDCVLVKDELFASFDKFWKPWFPAEDALKIAADLLTWTLLGLPRHGTDLAARPTVSNFSDQPALRIRKLAPGGHRYAGPHRVRRH